MEIKDVMSKETVLALTQELYNVIYYEPENLMKNDTIFALAEHLENTLAAIADIGGYGDTFDKMMRPE